MPSSPAEAERNTGQGQDCSPNRVSDWCTHTINYSDLVGYDGGVFETPRDHSPRAVAQATNPPLALFDVVAFACLTLLTLTETFGALPAAIAALGAARYILSQPETGAPAEHPPR